MMASGAVKWFDDEKGTGMIQQDNGDPDMPFDSATPFNEAQPSPDGEFWRCKRADGSRRCFFAPPPTD